MRKYRSGSQWAFARWTVVSVEEVEYLRRLHLVKTPWFSLMAHWISRPDPQPDLHDHPVSFISLILRGEYTEERRNGVFRRRFLNRLRATDAHRIIETRGTVLSLVLAGPKRREWGFHTPAGWINWRDYEAAR